MPRRPASTRALGQTLEDSVVRHYGGRRSPSSGATSGDKGDVRFQIRFVKGGTPSVVVEFDYTAECKTTENKSISIKKDVWDKVEQEAKEHGRRPCMFIRFFDQDTGKHKDLVIRDVNDDLEMFT